MADKTGQKPVIDLLALHESRRLIGEFIQARPLGRHRQIVKSLFHGFFPQIDIERALTAMLGMGGAHIGNQRRQLRFVQPARHHLFQHPMRRHHPGRIFVILGIALAGDHQHQPVAASVRRNQPSAQSAMRRLLGHAMQIDAGIGFHQPAPQPLLGGAIDAAGAAALGLFRHRLLGRRRPDRAAFLEGLLEQLAFIVAGNAPFPKFVNHRGTL